jgi:hypothetical protein
MKEEDLLDAINQTMPFGLSVYGKTKAACGLICRSLT